MSKKREQSAEELAGVPQLEVAAPDLAALESSIAPEPPATADSAEPGTPSQEDGSAAPQLPPKRRRRRSRKPQEAESTAEPAPMSSQERATLSVALGTAFTIAASTVARVRGRDHWQITSEDAQRLGDVWADALAPYMSAGGKYMPFAIAALVTVDVVMPRLEADSQLDKLASAEPRPVRAVGIVPSESGG